MKRFLTAGLLLLQAAAWAQNLPALPASAIPTLHAGAARTQGKGLPLSIQSGTQGIVGKLGIGVGYIGGGVYDNEKGKRVSGLHASLSISVDGAPSLFSQPDVREGQDLMIANYRIRVDRILPANGGTGVVVLRVWAPPKPAKVKTSWLNFLGL
jgi:hypothetical protein